MATVFGVEVVECLSGGGVSDGTFARDGGLGCSASALVGLGCFALGPVGLGSSLADGALELGSSTDDGEGGAGGATILSKYKLMIAAKPANSVPIAAMATQIEAFFSDIPRASPDAYQFR